MKKNIFAAINIINILSLLSVLASLILLDFTLAKIAFYMFFVSYFIEIFTDKKWKHIKLDKKRVYFLFMLAFFMLALISIPFDSSPVYTKILMEKRYGIFGFAVVGFFGVNKYFKLSYIINGFVITSVLTIFYLLFYRFGINDFIAHPNRFEEFNLLRSKYVNTHMIFNFYLNISLIGIWYILTRQWSKIKWWWRYLYIAALTLIFSTLSISEGRSGFIIGILLLAGFTFLEIWERRKTIGIIVALLIPFMLIGIASTHKRISEKMIEGEPRWFLWQSGVDVIKQSPIWGHGISNAQELFDISRAKFQTEEYRLQWIKAKHLDSHNQLIQTTMEFGIVGIVLLIFLYIYPIFISDKNTLAFSVFVIGLCIYQSTFDMFITGQFCILFGILIIGIISARNDIGKNMKKKRKLI
jgi:O-antigen ligase